MSESPKISHWELASSEAQGCLSVDELEQTTHLQWLSAIVPGTVAQTLQAEKLWQTDHNKDFDSHDWWYKTQFDSSKKTSDEAPVILCLDGLSTLCEIWLNGVLLQSTNNMFLEYQIDIAPYLKTENTLYLCFRSLTHALSHRQARPKWKTKLVSQQTLRNQRTTLLGRIPGWTPPISPVGPWRQIYIREPLTPINIKVQTRLEKSKGIVAFSCEVINFTEALDANLKIGDISVSLAVENNKKGIFISAEVEIDDVKLWWPHTHGDPFLYDAQLTLSQQNNDTHFALTPVGFKQVELEQTNDDFKIDVNGEKIFCRGACWTVNDIISLIGDPDALKQTLVLMRDAGANMIRVGGTMIYEQDLFYKLCDELGIMIWQDFMFANMDYPVEQDAFLELIKNEAAQKINTLSQHPCISLYCGNSEIEQQASMLGMEKNVWCNDFFAIDLPKLCSDFHAGIPYISSTPSGGVLPFHTNSGVTHYYGVGAYLCSVSELRQHNVKFTSECLGFSNIPVSTTRNSVLDGQLPATHNPKWKERVPRDSATGWDFEDVRDHYLKEFYTVDPVTCRSYDVEKYLSLSENVTGEIMSQVFSEWRSSHSDCNGALVWFLKDFLPGAGWGIIDSLNQPKACYYHLKRVWQSVNVVVTDESLNGLHIHLLNETNEEVNADLHMKLINDDGIVIKTVTSEVSLQPKSKIIKQSDEMLDAFYDITYRYRFGPAKHTVVALQLIDSNGLLLSDSFYFVKPYTLTKESNTQLDVSAYEIDADTYQLDIISNRFLHGLNIDVAGFIATDNFFNLVPDLKRSVTMRRDIHNKKKFKGYVSALNLSDVVKIKLCKSK